MHMNAIFVNEQGEGYQTGVSADFGSEKATKEAFYSLKPEATNSREAPFIIDLWDCNGDLVESVGISAELYKRVTGEPVLSEEEYRKINSDYWAEAEKHVNEM